MSNRTGVRVFGMMLLALASVWATGCGVTPEDLEPVEVDETEDAGLAERGERSSEMGNPYSCMRACENYNNACLASRTNCTLRPCSLLCDIVLPPNVP